jgi:hypothetical protein
MRNVVHDEQMERRSAAFVDLTTGGAAMKSKTHTSQKDPPEGSRAVVERELKRTGDGGKQRQAEESSDARKRNKKALDEAAPQTGTRGGP